MGLWCGSFQSPSDNKTGEVKTLCLYQDLLFAGDDKGIVSQQFLQVLPTFFCRHPKLPTDKNVDIFY
jgi:hypothetical protein